MEQYQEGSYGGRVQEVEDDDAFWDAVLNAGYEPETDEDADLSSPPSPDDDLWLTDQLLRERGGEGVKRASQHSSSLPQPNQLSIYDAIADIETYRNRIG